MNFELTEDQQMLVETVASFVRKESPVGRLRKLREDPIGYSPTLWKQMGELGWLGILIPEAAGGFGGSMVDGCLMMEQLGTTLVPEPFLASVILAGLTLAQAGNDAQLERWLQPMMSGDSSLALAYAERESRFDVTRVGARAERHGDLWRLTGEKVFVLNGHAADAILVSARTSGEVADRAGISLFILERGMPGLTIRPIKTMDGHHAALLTLEGVEVGADRLLGEEGGAAGALEAAMDRGAAAACAEGVGIMRTVLQMTSDYLNTREQFGVKIGTFQALQHRAVDMFIETELARSASIMAAIKVSDPDEMERKSAISAAKAQIAQSGRFVTQQSIQLFGGIGVTDEHDVGLYFKRMHILNTLFGDEEFHVVRFASLPTFTAGVLEAG